MNSAQARLMIGPSTGWLYARKIYSLTQQETILKVAGANSVEICLANWESKDKRTLSLKAGEIFDAQIFIYRSLHLPDVGEQEPERQLLIAQEAVVNCGAAVAVTHPLKAKGDYPVESYEKMITAGVPLAIENMDLDKDSGFDIRELEGLTTIGCKFVLDVEHAYGRDPEMNYAGDLFESLKDQLVHLHVSGETDNNNHSLVYKATNAKRVVEFVGRALSIKNNIPLILEGEYSTSDELRKEIEFLTKELIL